MKLAGSFEAAVEVAEQNCREWIFLGSGEVYLADEMYEIAKEFDEKTPLEEEDFLAVTDDGSIGLLFPHCKEPQWYFVSPEFAVVNVLKEDPRKYMIATNDGAMAAVGTSAAMGNAAKVGSVINDEYGSTMTNRTANISAMGNVVNGANYNRTEASAAFCKNCGAPLESNSLFCGECGAKNAPEFCSNCGAKLNPGSKFCANCGTKV